MFVQMLLGHILGDYFFQTNWMALNKTKKSWLGWKAVLLHTITYTFAVCLFMWTFDWYWIVVVFLSHIFIDHYGLAKWFMGTKIKGLPYPKPNDNMNYVSLYWIIYVAIDNGAHLMLMWGAHTLLY